MNVKQLIEKLQQQNPEDIVVMTRNPVGKYEIENIASITVSKGDEYEPYEEDVNGNISAVYIN
jgi:hypothetical protein